MRRREDKESDKIRTNNFLDIMYYSHVANIFQVQIIVISLSCKFDGSPYLQIINIKHLIGELLK